MLTNVRIDYKDGEDTASMKAYALCQHARLEGASSPMDRSSRLVWIIAVEVVKGKEDGLWKIKKCGPGSCLDPGGSFGYGGRTATCKMSFWLCWVVAKRMFVVLVACMTEIK